MLLFSRLFGIDRDLRIDQLHHSSWTRKDGAPAEVLALAQTADGFLWIGTRDGLYRFDGVHFELYQSTDGKTLPDANVKCLLAMPDGGLWVGATNATFLLKDGRISTYPDSAESGHAAELALDEEVWFGEQVPRRGPRGSWVRAGKKPVRTGGFPGALTACIWITQGPFGWIRFMDWSFYPSVRGSSSGPRTRRPHGVQSRNPAMARYGNSTGLRQRRQNFAPPGLDEFFANSIDTHAFTE